MNFEHDNHSGTDGETKRPYDAPTLVRYGDLDELTHDTTVKAPTADANSLP
ncbi:MAG: lasso RiPP family leader peptide-containing protein [Actinobacteria bacterium]|nr:lasso RiPP family leader peptide-containing protein [Actinomycetota bacterium]